MSKLKIAELALCIGLGAVVIIMAAFDTSARADGKETSETIRRTAIAICIVLILILTHFTISSISSVLDSV